jgi:hypothetical protein
MSKGHSRRENDLANFENEFLLALEKAKLEKHSAYISEKKGKRTGAALPLDVELFTLESKIDRLRELLGMEPFEIPLPKPDVAPRQADGTWPDPPDHADAIYPMDPRDLWNELEQSGRVPGDVFNKVKCAGAKARQGADQSTWRLGMVEVSDGRVPARATLTLFPLPNHADAAVAGRKLHAALPRIVGWTEKAVETPAEERPRVLHINYTRENRELGFSAR